MQHFGIGRVDVACAVAVVQLRFDAVVCNIGRNRIVTQLRCQLRGTFNVIGFGGGLELFECLVLIMGINFQRAVGIGRTHRRGLLRKSVEGGTADDGGHGQTNSTDTDLVETRHGFSKK